MSHDVKCPALLPDPERLSQALLDAAPTVLYIFDLHERGPLFVSPRSLEFLGLSGDGASEIDPGFFVRMMHPDDQRVAGEHFRQITTLADGETREFEYRMRAADGGWRWFRSRDVVFARDLDGQPRQLLGVALEITERKQMEEALRESEGRFRTSVETMLDAFGVYTAVRDDAGEIVDFRIEYVNEAACAANRLSREEQVGRLLCEVLPAHRGSGLFDAYCRLVETGESLHREVLDYEDHYGGQLLRRAFDIQATKLGDGFAASWRDVTGRKRAEDRLRESEKRSRENEQRLQSALAIARLSPYEWNPATGELVWDANLKAMWGLLAEAKVDHAVFLSGLHPEDRADVERRLTRALDPAGDGIYEAEFRVIGLGDRIERWILARGQATFGDDGRPVSLVGVVKDVTERRATAAALVVANERFNRAEEAARAFTYEWDLVTDRVERSPGLRAVLGYAPEELAPTWEAWAALLHPDDLTTTKAEAVAALATLSDGSPGYEYRVRHKNGEFRWLHERATLLRDGGGTVRRVIGQAMDVTERKRTEDTLRDRERFVSGVVNAAPGLVYVYDLATGRNLYVNDQMERLFGWTREDIDRLGDGFLFRLIHPDDVSEVAQQAERCWTLADGEVIELEYRLRRKEGDWRWVRSRDTVFSRDAAGNVAQILGLADDVTGRKRSEEALAETTAQREAMLDHLPVGLAFFDRDMRFVRVNPEMARMTGRPAEAHLGQRLEEVLPNSGPEIRERIEEVFATGEGMSNVEVSGPSPLHAGEIGHALASWYPVKVGGETVLVGAAVLDISERKRAEEALRRSELIFRRLADTNLMGVGFGDLSGAVTYANDELLRMMGRTRAEFEAGAIDWAECVAPEHRADSPRIAEQLLCDGQIIGYERAFLRPDGGRTPYLGAAALVSPNSDFHVSIALDLTQIRGVEDSLRESEGRFRTMADETPVIIWASDAAGGIEFINRAYSEFFGVTEEVVRGPNWQPLLHPDDAEAYISAFRAALDVRTSFHAEARVRRADGTWRWIESFGAPRLSATGELVGMVGSSPDITERKEADSERERLLAAENLARQVAQEAEARYRGLFEGVADALLVADADARYRDANPAAIALLGYGLEELRDLRVADVVAYATEWTAAEYARFRDEGAWRGELELRRKDGSIIPVEALATVVALPTGPMYLSAVRDISERKRAETERVSFLDAVAHDVKNPLTAAKGRAQLLRRRLQKETTDTAGIEANLDSIAAAIDESVALVDELLDAAHLRAGQSLELYSLPTDLAALVEAVAAETRQSTTRHVIQVKTAITELVGVWDGPRLRRVLANLLGNAVKYSPDGGEIVVRIEREMDGEGESWAVIVLTDQGIGVPAADLPHLFVRFHRGSNVAHIGGTGMGLAGAKRIIEQHGGSIGVVSVEGQGSSFTVRLPLGSG